AFFEAAQTERIAVTADVSIFRDEQPEARGLAAGTIGEKARAVVAAVLAVRNELAEEQLARDEIEDEETRLRRRERVVDDRDHVAALQQPTLVCRLCGVEGEAEDFGAQTWRLPEQRGREGVGGTLAGCLR